MKTKIFIGIGFLFFLLAIAPLTGRHGDGFVDPTILIRVFDKENKPIQNVSITFIEKVREQKYESHTEEYLETFERIGRLKKTDSKGEAAIIAPFAIARCYYEILNKHFFPSTRIFDDGVLIISNEEYDTKKVLIDKKTYRKEILNEGTLLFEVILEKIL
jgi:hypothetical protein